MQYNPGPFPSSPFTPEKLAETLFRELLEVARTSAFAEDLILPYLHAAPSKILSGMIVLADGTDWDPGSGAGLYRRNEANNAWVFIA